jgi:hypothetical protein
MIIGGSAGLRMMIALPLVAPPTSIARAVVLGELVDVGAGAGAGRARGDRGDDLGVCTFRHRADGRDHRDRRLPAAGHHVDVGRIEVLVHVDRRITVKGPIAAGVRSSPAPATRQR